jgi:hypothetical protein
MPINCYPPPQAAPAAPYINKEKLTVNSIEFLFPSCKIVEAFYWAVENSIFAILSSLMLQTLTRIILIEK